MSQTLELTQNLMARRSVTPADEGCQAVMTGRLAALGFKIEPLRYGNVENFWATHGSDGPVFCFVGHTDVVPTGPPRRVEDGPVSYPRSATASLYGRGAADMKSGLAAMITLHRGVRARSSAAQRDDRVPYH